VPVACAARSQAAQLEASVLDTQWVHSPAPAPPLTLLLLLLLAAAPAATFRTPALLGPHCWRATVQQLLLLPLQLPLAPRKHQPLTVLLLFLLLGTFHSSWPLLPALPGRRLLLGLVVLPLLLVLVSTVQTSTQLSTPVDPCLNLHVPLLLLLALQLPSIPGCSCIHNVITDLR
jgi:hypothetical protein